MNVFVKLLGFLFLNLLFCELSAQNELHIDGGLSVMYTEHPAVNPSNHANSGYHFGMKGRMGKTRLFFQPGISFHVLKMKALPNLDPFAEGSEMYLLKIPLQAGFKILRNDRFALSALAGGQAGFITAVDKGDTVFGREDVNDVNFGFLVGGAIDLGVLRVSVNFEKGASAFFKLENYKSDFVFVSLGFTL